MPRLWFLLGAPSCKMISFFFFVCVCVETMCIYVPYYLIPAVLQSCVELFPELQDRGSFFLNASGEQQLSLPSGPLYSRLSLLAVGDYVNTTYVIHILRVGEAISLGLSGSFSEAKYPDLAGIVFREERRLQYQLGHRVWHVPDIDFSANITLLVNMTSLIFAPIVSDASGSQDEGVQNLYDALGLLLVVIIYVYIYIFIYTTNCYNVCLYIYTHMCVCRKLCVYIYIYIYIYLFVAICIYQYSGRLGCHCCPASSRDIDAL